MSAAASFLTAMSPPSSAQSRDALFGDEAPAKTGAPTIAWHGFVRGELAYTYGEPDHWSKMLVRAELDGFADIQINYGIAGDKPVTGDSDYDGIDTIGVYRNGTFYLRNSNTIGFADIVFALGIPGDHPIAGNWDGLP